MFMRSRFLLCVATAPVSQNQLKVLAGDWIRPQDVSIEVLALQFFSCIMFRFHVKLSGVEPALKPQEFF